MGLQNSGKESRRAGKALSESEEHFRLLVKGIKDYAIFMLDPQGHVVSWNPGAKHTYGYREEEILRQHFSVFYTHDDVEQGHPEEELRVAATEGRYEEEGVRVRKDGTTFWAHEVITALNDEADDLRGFAKVTRDITERKALEERLEHQALHDSLTDLPNRTLFLDRLKHALARTHRESSSIVVLLMDLNNFKAINDSLGHEAGNAVLVNVAERLRGCVRPEDTVGRIFGDEFAVLLDAPSGVVEGRRVAERIQECLRAPLDVEGQEVYVSLSIGIALNQSAEEQPEQILRRADLAMYEAKRRGRSQYQVYNPSINSQAVKRMNLENELRRSIRREEFEVYYQPIVELRTSEVVAVEALARWRHPERGLVEAEEFIELAEETGLIRPIGQRVVEEACQQAKEWRERYVERPPLVSVNLSAGQFGQQHSDLIPKVLDDTGLEPSTLQVEITERAMMDDAESSLGKLKELKDLGVSLAIDDFGMGYSCLYYLKHMPIDFLKIDRSFIAGLGNDQGDEAIVAGTIGLAHALGVITVAEGVETAAQSAILKELGCDLAQSYYFARPLPSEAVERLLAENISS